jgi:hypothetical protein
MGDDMARERRGEEVSGEPTGWECEVKELEPCLDSLRKDGMFPHAEDSGSLFGVPRESIEWYGMVQESPGECVVIYTKVPEGFHHGTGDVPVAPVRFVDVTLVVPLDAKPCIVSRLAPAKGAVPLVSKVGDTLVLDLRPMFG